jgi:multidrug resistance efflux pump
VKAGDLLAAITAAELDHQIAQAEANLAQAKASRRQTKANRELARVTWGRDSVLVRQGWVTQEQGDTDRLHYAAQQQAKQVNDAAIQSMEAQLLVPAPSHSLRPWKTLIWTLLLGPMQSCG